MNGGVRLLSTHYAGSLQLLSHDQDVYETQESTETTQSCLRLSFRREISTPRKKKNTKISRWGFGTSSRTLTVEERWNFYCSWQHPTGH